jgi:hypothetical protein
MRLLMTMAVAVPWLAAGGGGAAPIEARLLPPFHGQLVVDLNQPAYVAIFDVKTARGADLLYPGPNGAGQAVKGISVLPVITLGPGQEERQILFTPDAGGNDYLLLVASREPLNLSRWANVPIALSDSAHLSREAVVPPDAIDSLEKYILPPMADRDWDEDVFILAPGLPSPNGTGNYLLCSDGSMRLVPNDYPFLSCRHGGPSAGMTIASLSSSDLARLRALAVAGPSSSESKQLAPTTKATGGVSGSGKTARGDQRDGLGGGGSVSHGGSSAVTVVGAVSGAAGGAAGGGAAGGGGGHAPTGGRP